MPYMEQTSLWQNPDDAFLQKTPVAGYFCPTRRRPMVIAGGRAVNDYAGNGGIYTSSGYAWGDGATGCFVRNTRAAIGFNAVTDGTTNTILAGEKRLDLKAMGSFQCDDNEGSTAGWDWDVIRWGNDPPMRDRNDYDQCEVLFGSSHVGGPTFVMTDGSVRIISYGVDKTMFQRACNREDAQSVDFSSF